jgi:hypothetical protein
MYIGSQVDSVVTGESAATDSDEEIDGSRHEIIENIERKNDNVNDDNDIQGVFFLNSTAKKNLHIHINLYKKQDYIYTIIV